MTTEEQEQFLSRLERIAEDIRAALAQVDPTGESIAPAAPSGA